MSDNADMPWESWGEMDRRLARSSPPPLTDIQLLAVAVLKGDDTAAHALADAVVERARGEGHVPYADLVARLRAVEKRCPWAWEGRRVRVQRRDYPGQSHDPVAADGTVEKVRLSSFMDDRYVLVIRYDDDATSEEWAFGQDIELLD